MGKIVQPGRKPDSCGLYRSDGRRKYINGDERQRFLEAAARQAPEVGTFCLTLAFTGCRITEALNLTPADIEQAAGLIAVRCLKKRGGQVIIREIPAPPALLKRLMEVHGLAALRISPAARVRLWHWGRTKAWQLVKGVMNEAAISGLPATPRGLRHGFGAHAVLSGVPLTMVQKWLGHADIETTAIYTAIMGPEERQVAGRMW